MRSCLFQTFDRDYLPRFNSRLVRYSCNRDNKEHFFKYAVHRIDLHLVSVYYQTVSIAPKNKVNILSRKKKKKKRNVAYIYPKVLT